MGNFSARMFPSTNQKNSVRLEESFQFHEQFLLDDEFNGLCFNGIYLPPEVVTLILSNVPPRQILKCSLVCKQWCNIIKSTQFWTDLYTTRSIKNKPKQLPWYVYYCYFAYDYFDKNLLRNGNGQEGFSHWKIIRNYGDRFKIEDPPAGADPLPVDCADFEGRTSCFATSYYECCKMQQISFNRSNLMKLIFRDFKPHVYASEWVAGRFDCGSIYQLGLYLRRHLMITQAGDRGATPTQTPLDEHGDNRDLSVIAHCEKTWRVEQWAGKSWEKIEILIKDYPDSEVHSIVFQHEGRDTQFWKGHYGSKMAGGVVKILFDSIELKDDDSST